MQTKPQFTNENEMWECVCGFGVDLLVVDFSWFYKRFEILLAATIFLPLLHNNCSSRQRFRIWLYFRMFAHRNKNNKSIRSKVGDIPNVTLHILWFRYFEHAFRFRCTKKNAKYLSNKLETLVTFIALLKSTNFIARFLIRLLQTFFSCTTPIALNIFSVSLFFLSLSPSLSLSLSSSREMS